MAQTKKQQGGASGWVTLVVMLLIFGSLYYFGMYRPDQQRKAERAAIAAQDHPESVPFDANAAEHDRRPTMTAPGRWIEQFGDNQQTVYEFTPKEVRRGSLDDFTGLDAASGAKLAGKDLYYVHYQVTYVNGATRKPYVKPELRLQAGNTVANSVVFMQMSGFKKKANKSGCEGTSFEGTFGKGSTLPACMIVSLPAGQQPTALSGRDIKGVDQPVSWPVTVSARS